MVPRGTTRAGRRRQPACTQQTQQSWSHVGQPRAARRRHPACTQQTQQSWPHVGQPRAGRRRRPACTQQTHQSSSHVGQPRAGRANRQPAPSSHGPAWANPVPAPPPLTLHPANQQSWSCVGQPRTGRRHPACTQQTQQSWSHVGQPGPAAACVLLDCTQQVSVRLGEAHIRPQPGPQRSGSPPSSPPRQPCRHLRRRSLPLPGATCGRSRDSPRAPRPPAGPVSAEHLKKSPSWPPPLDGHYGPRTQGTLPACTPQNPSVMVPRGPTPCRPLHVCF
jgi:hypothetical protein